MVFRGKFRSNLPRRTAERLEMATITILQVFDQTGKPQFKVNSSRVADHPDWMDILSWTMFPESGGGASYEAAYKGNEYAVPFIQDSIKVGNRVDKATMMLYTTDGQWYMQVDFQNVTFNSWNISDKTFSFKLYYDTRSITYRSAETAQIELSTNDPDRWTV
jgi:hypothetical protein